MNKSVNFVDSVLDHPEEILGISRSGALDLAVDYLVETKSAIHLPLLKKTIRSLYAGLMPALLQNHNATHTLYKLLSRLQKSHWQQEATEEIIDIYLKHPAHDNPMDGLIENYLSAIEDQSKFLVTERLRYTFDRDVVSESAVEQIIYCLHVVNVTFALQVKDFEFNYIAFATYVKLNILSLLDHEHVVVKRTAVWALYWFSNAFRSDSRLPPFTNEELTVLRDVLEQDADYKTNIRLCIILIKSTSNVLNRLDKTLTGEWTYRLYKKEFDKKPDRAEALVYDPLVRQRLVESLDWENDAMRDEIVIPYLVLTTDEDNAGKLYENLNSGEFQKMNSEIVLYGAGWLTAEQAEKHNLGTTLFFDKVVRLNTDLCFQVGGKDTTGKVAWYFVFIDRDMKEEFLKHKSGDNYDLADYGRMITSGYGSEVPDDIKAALKEKYGFDNF